MNQGIGGNSNLEKGCDCDLHDFVSCRSSISYDLGRYRECQVHAPEVLIWGFKEGIVSWSPDSERWRKDISVSESVRKHLPVVIISSP